MIDKATALETILRKLHQMEQGHCLDLRTYKRNRSVVIKKMGPDAFVAVQDGFAQERHEVRAAGLRRLLKSLLKKEFPRSTKIRVYDLGPCDPEARREMKTL